MIKRFQIVEITWLDSKGVTSSWEYLDEVEPLEPVVITSVGYLLQNSKKYKTIAQSVSKHQVVGRMTIPTVTIQKIRKISGNKTA